MRHLALAVWLTICVSACGSVGDDGSAKFTGTWTYTAGMLNATCLTMPLSADLTGSSLIITKGTTSALVVEASSTCQVRFNVDGNKASAQGGQSCMQSFGMYGPQTITFSSWTLETSDGQAMTSAFAGTVNASFMGVMIPCNATGSGSLTKTAQADGGP